MTDAEWAERALSFFWLCPHQNNYWLEIFWWFSGVFGKDNPPDPELAHFGCSEAVYIYTCGKQSALMLGMRAAKKMIPTSWKSPTPHSFQKWLNKMIIITLSYKWRIWSYKFTASKWFLRVWGAFTDCLLFTCTLVITDYKTLWKWLTNKYICLVAFPFSFHFCLLCFSPLGSFVLGCLHVSSI